MIHATCNKTQTSNLSRSKMATLECFNASAFVYHHQWQSSKISYFKPETISQFIKVSTHKVSPSVSSKFLFNFISLYTMPYTTGDISHHDLKQVTGASCSDSSRKSLALIPGASIDTRHHHWRIGYNVDALPVAYLQQLLITYLITRLIHTDRFCYLHLLATTFISILF